MIRVFNLNRGVWFTREGAHGLSTEGTEACVIGLEKLGLVCLVPGRVNWQNVKAEKWSEAKCKSHVFAGMSVDFSPLARQCHE